MILIFYLELVLYMNHDLHRLMGISIPFGKADLATIVLASVPMLWQNQFNLNHSMVPESTCMLLPDLEAIEWVMVEKHDEKFKAKGEAGTARSKAKSNPERKASGGLTGQVLPVLQGPQQSLTDPQHLGLPLLWQQW